MKVLILLLLFLSACSEENPRLTTEYYSELPELKGYVLNLRPELSSLSGERLAFALRDVVNKETLLKASDERYNPSSPLSNFKNIVELGDYGHYCGGMAHTLSDLLRAFGFEAAVIQMNNENNETHVTTEALVNGKWMALDATFNVSLKGGIGQSLDFNEAKRNGFSLSTDGFSTVRPAEDYPVSYETFLFNFYDIERG